MSPTQFVSAVPDLLTPLAFCENYPPDHFPLQFYRLPIAPDLVIRPEELDLAAIDRRRHLLVHGDRACRPSRAGPRTTRPGRPGARKPHTILDLDYRDGVLGGQGRWPASRSGPRCRRSPWRSATRRNARSRSARPSHAGRPKRCWTPAWRSPIVKQGPKGVLGMTRDEIVEVPPTPVMPINGLGAGDSFGGAFCHGLLDGLGPGDGSCGSPTRPARSSPPAGSAPPRCRPPTRLQLLLKEVQHV